MSVKTSFEENHLVEIKTKARESSLKRQWNKTKRGILGSLHVFLHFQVVD